MLSPAGFVSAAATSTPKNFAVAKHLRGPGPSLLRYMDGMDGPAAFPGAAGNAEVEAVAVDPAGGVDLAVLAAAFLAAFSAFLRALLLGPEDSGAASCGRETNKMPELWRGTMRQYRYVERTKGDVRSVSL